MYYIYIHTFFVMIMSIVYPSGTTITAAFSV